MAANVATAATMVMGMIVKKVMGTAMKSRKPVAKEPATLSEVMIFGSCFIGIRQRF